MYNVLRKIHLYCGLCLAVFVFMYFFTGLPLIHESWIKNTDPRKTTVTEPIDFDAESGEKAFAAYLEKRFELHGQRVPPKKQHDGTWKFQWNRPGTEWQVTLAKDAKSAVITKLEHGPRHVVVRLHRLRGYGGNWRYNLWAFLLDLTSVSMILFTFTGIYLWWKLTKVRWPGVICLLVGFGLTAVTVVHFMTHR